MTTCQEMFQQALDITIEPVIQKPLIKLIVTTNESK